MFPTQIMQYLVRFIATMPSKMATQASWICEKKVDVQWKALGGKWG